MSKSLDKSIIVDHLSKNFEITKKESGLIGRISSVISPNKKTVRALRDISFSIDEGELVGFIGPNGAGKTTTMKILSGLLFPSRGFTQVLGFDPWERKPEYLRNIALVMGQKNQLWWDLPAIDTFELIKAIYEIPDKVYSKTLDELVSLLGVKKLLETQVRRLSLGQRMKLELIASLLPNPKVLFLDEPTIGLDLNAQQAVREFIFSYNKKYKATVLLTSHNMDDLARLAKRVIVLDRGQVLFDGDLKELVRHFAKDKMISLHLSSSVDIKSIEKIGKLVKYNFPHLTLKVPRDASAVAASELLQNFPISDLEIEEIPIEDVIRRVFKGEMTKKKPRKTRKKIK